MEMKDLEALGKELVNGPQGSALREAAESDAAKALGQKLDAGRVEAAARSGDAAQLKSILTEVLATEEGRALAEKLSGLRL